jgi:hypothetical protein
MTPQAAQPPTPTTTPATTATERFRRAAHRTGLVDAIRVALGLSEDRRYDLGIVRVSVSNTERLERQEEAGLRIFQNLADWHAFGQRSQLDQARDFISLRCCDLDARAGKVALGTVGLIGETVFLAVHASATQGSLPPAAGDVADLERNAFTEAAIAVGLAAQVQTLYVPFRSRWWRSELYATRLKSALVRNLPDVKFIEGTGEVDLTPAGELIESVKGGAAAQQASQNKIHALEKALTSLEEGRWPRADHELPTGLRRKPQAGRIRWSDEVELVPEEVDAMRELLAMFGKGRPIREIGGRAQALELQLRGALGLGRTYADVHPNDLGQRTMSLFSDKALHYYEHGWWTQRLSTSLAVDKVPGHVLAFDTSNRQRYKEVVCDKFPFPDEGFADEATWQAIHARLEAQQADRARRRGGASHERVVGAAFTGVSAQIVTAEDGSEVEHLFASESPTAYRLRVRGPELRGARNREGEAVATFRKVIFDRAAGRALLSALEAITDPIAPIVCEDPTDPLATLRAELASLEGDRDRADAAARRWDSLFESEEDPSERAHLHDKAKQARARSRSLTAEIDAAVASLESTQHEVVALDSHDDADVTLPVLVADGLLASDGSPPVQIRDGLRRLGVHETLRCTPETKQWWSFNATAVLDMVDGTTRHLPLSWSAPSSADSSGVLAGSSPALIVHWAAGLTIEDAADLAGLDHGAAQRHLRRKFGSRTMVDVESRRIKRRGLLSAALHLPVAETRQVIASRVLDDAELAANVPEHWRRHIEDTYFTAEPSKWGSFWCPPELAVPRQILADLTNSGPDGIDAEAIARRHGLRTEDVRRMIRQHDLGHRHGRRIRPRSCSQPSCNGVLGHLLPTPETRPHGLICTSCWHTESGVLVPAGYLEHHTWDGTTTSIAPPPAPLGRIDDHDRRLTSQGAADRLGISAWLGRELADHGEIACIRGNGGYGGGRLFTIQAVDELDRERGDELRARCVSASDELGLVTQRAAAYLDTSPHGIKQLIRAGCLRHTTDASGHRRFRTEDLDSVPAEAIRLYASDLVSLQDVAEAAGLANEVITSLAQHDMIPHHVSTNGRRRFSLPEALAAIDELNLFPGDEILTIGEAADLLGVSQIVLRARSDDGTVPTAYRTGGTRRYRLRDIERVRAAGTPLVRARGLRG